jgi:hypothetical protein
MIGLGLSLTNVAATSGGGAPAPATLSPTDHSASITLSNGNLTVTTALATGPFGIRASRAVSAGAKIYWEVHVDAYNSAEIFGLADSTASFTASLWGVTANPDAAGWFSTTLRYNTTTQAVADKAPASWVGFAYDDTAKKLWIRNSTGWLNGDPVAGTSGLSVSGIGASVFPAFQGDNGDAATFNFGASAYQYAPPSGYGNL